jgi:hypothetical protein
MDNDNNMDVVASAGTDDILAWFENPDWTQHNIDDNLNGACGVAAVDINGDDTLDVVCAGFYSNEIKWYEAPDWEEHLIDSEVTSGSATEGPEYIYVLDIDGDQDLDVICTSVDENDYSKGNIILYNGPEWAKQVIDNTASWTNAMVFADMDQDGDLDALATGMSADKIFMYELPDWTRTTVDNNLESAVGVDVGDLDMDGSLDIVGAGQVNANPLRWYTGSNWEQNVLYTAGDNMNSVFITDLEEDGDLDIVVTISELNKVVWLENLILGIEQLGIGIPKQYSLSQNYPNPFNPSTTITFSISKTEHVSLKVYNNLGQEVATLVSAQLTPGSYQFTWDAGTLTSSVYYYKLQAGAYIETKKLILLR